MFQSEMSDLMSGVSPELLLLGHEEEIENHVSEILLQDFNNFQNFALDHQDDDGFNKQDLMDEVMNDMIYPSAKPSDITGQTLAVTMEADKTKVLNSMVVPTGTSMSTGHQADTAKEQQYSSNWMESTVVDMDNHVNELLSSDANEIQETQEVIDEIQDFLDKFVDEEMDQDDEVRNLADELLSEGQKATLQSMNIVDCPLANSTLNEDEASAAEDLLDHLIQGHFTAEEIKELEQQSVSTNNDTGYSSTTPSMINVSNVSQVITDDGHQVIIVIGPSSNDEVQYFPNMVPTTPTTSTTNEVLASFNVPINETSYEKSEADNEVSDDEGNNSEEDSDWFPENEITTTQLKPKAPIVTTTNKRGRRAQERTKSTTAVASNGRVTKIRSVKDRKERKKLQNVEAARRYRDKKKAEELVVEDEEKQLMDKNSQLKETLKGIDGELNTIKKLMKELGLIKLVNPSSSHVK